MLKKQVSDKLNKQVNAEIYSAYLYLSMAAYFDSLNLAGFSNWMKVQAQEEMMHAMKIYNFIYDKGGAVTLTAIDAPETQWESPEAAVQDVCVHEEKVTGMINDLVDCAVEQHDHATNAFLQWFVNEQVEEEASAGDVLSKVQMVEKTSHGLYMLDKDLAARVFTPPQDAEGG